MSNEKALHEFEDEHGGITFNYADPMSSEWQEQFLKGEMPDLTAGLPDKARDAARKAIEVRKKELLGMMKKELEVKIKSSSAKKEYLDIIERAGEMEHNIFEDTY